MAGADKIVRRKLSDEVHDRLVGMIESGVYKAGDQMPSERELMERFEVGRPAIREAMQSMVSQGLLTISQGERARVTRPTARTVMGRIDAVARHMLATSPQSLEHLKEARLFFEVGMARIAARRASPQDVETLRRRLAAQRACVGVSERFVDADMAFHRAIGAMSGNPIYEAVSAAMLDWVFEHHTELLVWTGRESTTLSEHRLIVDTIEANDAEAAADAMAAHINRSRNQYALRPRGGDNR